MLITASVLPTTSRPPKNLKFAVQDYFNTAWKNKENQIWGAEIVYGSMEENNSLPNPTDPIPIQIELTTKRIFKEEKTQTQF